jgi:hypothetical protein
MSCAISNSMYSMKNNRLVLSKRKEGTEQPAKKVSDFCVYSMVALAGSSIVLSCRTERVGQ